jgi:DNA-binding MarR family transcriptional regulator/GNAT superfamily N-acetyltransferase
VPSRDPIDTVRAFNRFYTRTIGLLDERFLGTEFTLTQARVLFELGRGEPVRASALASELSLDKGYLSRLLKSLASKGLLSRTDSDTDRRSSPVSLTAKGHEIFLQLDLASRQQTSLLLEGIEGDRRESLVSGMASICKALEPSSSNFTLRPHRPGDIGWVIARHGEVYSGEYGWDISFEGFVAGIAGQFLERFDPERERCWIADREGERLGCVFLVSKSKTTAQLRMLLVERSARGLGVGSRLVDACIEFARQAGYKKLILWTNDILHSARHIYERAGFRLVKEESHRSFGQDLVGQSWELRL